MPLEVSERRGVGYEARHPEWHVIRHEDLASNPRDGFERLCAALELRVDPGMLRFIDRSTASTNPVHVEDPMDTRRDSKATIGKWKVALSEDETAYIREHAGAPCRHFYSDAEW